MLFILQLVLEIIHFLKNAVYYFFAFFLYIGRSIFIVITKCYEFVLDIFTAIGIIGDEFYNFICELDASISATIRYIVTNTNCCIECTLNSCIKFMEHVLHFLKITQLHSHLLASKVENTFGELFALVKRALLLIADCVWWLPRTVVSLVIFAVDGIIFSISFIGQLIMRTVHALVDDIFRLAVGTIVLFLLLRHRVYLRILLARYVQKVKLKVRTVFASLFIQWSRMRQRLRIRDATATFARQTHLSNHGSSRPSSNGEKIPDSQLCVICRDRAKSVLLLPCKHLCLCEECTDYVEFSSDNRHCPLCRSEIVYSISVFT